MLFYIAWRKFYFEENVVLNYEAIFMYLSFGSGYGEDKGFEVGEYLLFLIKVRRLVCLR